nr:hypothetical protein [Pseudomonas sp. Marseille-Q1929]
MRRVHKKFDIEGSFEKNAQTNAKWPQTLTRSAETDYFYNLCEPVDVEVETGLTPICFFHLDALEEGQVGYKCAGEPNKTELNRNWPAQHLVFMDDIGGGKPVIAVTDMPGTPVLASYDAIAPFKIADSLADFLLAFAKTVEIVHGKFDIFDIYNDDDELSSKFVKLLNKEVSPLLGADNYARFFDYFYG